MTACLHPQNRVTRPLAPAVPPPSGAGLDDPSASVCGWFDSSLDLLQGLAVHELAETDSTVLALWFGPSCLRGSRACS